MLPPTLSRRLAAVVEAYVARMRAEPAAEGDEALRLARSVEHIKKTRARRRARQERLHALRSGEARPWALLHRGSGA
jgi:hypothetical protein